VPEGALGRRAQGGVRRCVTQRTPHLLRVRRHHCCPTAMRFVRRSLRATRPPCGHGSCARACSLHCAALWRRTPRDTSASHHNHRPPPRPNLLSAPPELARAYRASAARSQGSAGCRVVRCLLLRASAACFGGQRRNDAARAAWRC
jgi:hypothetical protein